MKKLSYRKVKIFKIKNRKGYAALCLNNLTEGKTPYQAYERMGKALKRSGYLIPDISATDAAKLLVTMK